MRLPLALFAIALGAVEVAGALQELIYLGILQSDTDAMIAGALGTAAGAIVLAAGIALLVRSQRAPELALAAAYLSIPVFILIGVWKHRAAWPITTVGMIFPVLLALFCRWASARQLALQSAGAKQQQD